MGNVELHLGDSMLVLGDMPDNSVDSLVTDPPAGIGFMGKDWDGDKGGSKAWIAWLEGIMRECKRVMKPGAHGFVWALPRTSHWTAMALEQAGFEIRDVVTHVFGSGFPKSMDISKAIDKQAGAERPIVGQIKTHNIRGGALMERKPNEMIDVTAPATEAAKIWNGWGTALKPASEHWILVRKPIGEKTVAANVLKHGTGGINVDASRIAPSADYGRSAANSKGTVNAHGGLEGKAFKIAERDAEYASPLGRFPANFVLSHNHECDETCADDCAVKLLDEQSGPACGAQAPVRRKATPDTTNLSNFKPHSSVGDNGASFRGDSGAASRFFYVAKPSKRERNAGCEGLPLHASGHKANRRCGICNRQESSGSPCQCSRPEWFEVPLQPQANNHPTVKPTKLMTYLIRMITPPGGIVLDPFMGSGTTGVSAVQEGFRFIGIEQSPEYMAIAEARIGEGETLLGAA